MLLILISLLLSLYTNSCVIYYPNIRRELTTEVSEEDEEVEFLDLRALMTLE